MTYNELLGIFPPGARVICETMEQRRTVTEIVLNAGIDRANSDYADKILDGTADMLYMHPYHRRRDNGLGHYLTFNFVEPYGMDRDISYETFMAYVDALMGGGNFECGELESLLT